MRFFNTKPVPRISPAESSSTILKTIIQSPKHRNAFEMTSPNSKAEIDVFPPFLLANLCATQHPIQEETAPLDAPNLSKRHEKKFGRADIYPYVFIMTSSPLTIYYLHFPPARSRLGKADQRIKSDGSNTMWELGCLRKMLYMWYFWYLRS